VDAGTAIGGGHLSRCLTIANALKFQGVSECFFILKSHEGSFSSMIKNYGFDVKLLPLECMPNYQSGDYKDWLGGTGINDATSSLNYLNHNGFKSGDWLIVDHYGLDHEFEELIAQHDINIGVVDDLANRKHSCKFLVDQTCGREEHEYKEWVNNDATLMTGERFCMLRPEFLLFRQRSLEKRAQFKKFENIFINFGSTDPTNVTTIIINTLNAIKFQTNVNVVVAIGSNSPYLTEIRRCVENFSGDINLLIDAENMSELMYEADVAIGAAGATTWERCALGLPTVIIKTAENQSTVIDRIIEFGVAVLHDIDEKNQPDVLFQHLLYIEKYYRSMSHKCAKLVTADGINKVVARIIENNLR
jgi:UDP-2,4-diacetamido-2,4,6-trideoxy-beta-L-altropyranose hydrolase